MLIPPDALPGALLAADLIRAELRRADANLNHAAALTRHGEAGLDALEVRARLAAIGRLGLWAGRLRTVFAAPDPEARVAAVDALLVTTGMHVRVGLGAPPAGPTWRFETRAEGEGADAAGDGSSAGGAGVVSRVQAVTAGSLAWLVVAGAGDRLGLCALPWCGEPIVDTSRAGRRRYCSPRCANVVDVRAHRERRSAALP